MVQVILNFAEARLETLFKTDSCNFAKFLRTPFLQNPSGACFCLGYFFSNAYTFVLSTVW